MDVAFLEGFVADDQARQSAATHHGVTESSSDRPPSHRPENLARVYDALAFGMWWRLDGQQIAADSVQARPTTCPT